MIYKVNGCTYDVPAEADKFLEYRKQVWGQQGTKFENGKPIPSNHKALSFSISLAEYATQHWSAYKVNGEIEKSLREIKQYGLNHKPEKNK